MEQTPGGEDWPFVHVDVSMLGADEAARAVSDKLLRACGRQESFVAVVLMPETASGPQVRRLANVGERVRMLKQLRPELHRWCAGLAFVVSASMQQASAKAIRSGGKLWGCPTFTTDDPDAARAWAADQLNAASDTALGSDR